ncbi:MAG: DNA internalization-related competence protein ComEC/Rec2 [Balneola sp.]
MKKRSSYKFPFEQFPAVRVVLLFVTGIFLSSVSNISFLSSLAYFIVASVFYLTVELYGRDRISIVGTRIATFLFMLVIIFSGFSLHSYHAKKSLSLTERIISVSDWEEIQLTGTVVSVSRNSSGKKRLDLEVQKIDFSESFSSDKITARILWDIGNEVELGNQIEIKGTIIPISEPRNPTAFDYKEFLARRNIHSQIRADSLISVKDQGSTLSWISIRKKALEIVERNFNPITSPIAKALLLGYKNELEGDTRQAFARAGLSHIMAVSGLHVGLVIAPFWVIIPFFWTKKHGTKFGLAILITILFFYAGLTGFSAPVMRASLMATLLTYGKLFSKSANSINLMGVAALVILIIDPTQLFEVGFQLSFAAVLIILLVLPVIQSKIPYWIRIKWYGTPIMVIIISLVVQFGLYPLQAYYFGEVSIISPIANALFVPFLGIIVPLSLFALIIGLLLPSVGFILNYPSLLFLELLNDFVNFSTSLSWAWFQVLKPSSFLFLFWSFFILMVGSWRNPALKWKLMACALASVFVIQTVGLVQTFRSKDLTVVVFDVGQGDASLIKTPSGKHYLIDTGTWNPGSNSGENILLPYFKENNITKLDAVFLSHPHADHIGGIISLINGIEIDTIYNSGFQYDSNLYENYIKLAKAKHIPVISLHAGERINVDEEILILALGAEGPQFNDDPNQHSLVLNVLYKKNEFLFTGDAGEAQERRLLENYGDLLNTDFLKVGHHGSRTSSELFFLQAVTPEISVVSVANNNKFQHPHQEAVQRLETIKSDIYFTGRDKALVFKSDGKSIHRILWDK